MPQVRLVVSLGLPDPDRLSTTLVWSLMGHLGLLIGVLIYQSLPSNGPSRPDSFMVSLAAPAPPSGGSAAPPGPPEPPHEAPKTPAAAPAASKAAPTPVPVKTLPTEREKPPRPRQNTPHEPTAHTAREAPQADGDDDDAPAENGGHEGAAGATGSGADTGTGVSGTSFGEGDFHYGWYQATIEAKLQSLWRKPLASSSDIQTTTVSFTIQRDGSVHSVEISSPSGNSSLDLSVLRAVYDANPLPILPRAWSGESVHVSMEFRLTPGAP